jgi:hypothetical protein
MMTPPWVVANGELDRAIQAICKVPARTLRGAIAKARAADPFWDAGGEDIALSIVNDLVALGAVQL